jgi:NAD(P)-dependent dehydrogenase (short-subunit alcohol dehydrogenase family)
MKKSILVSGGTKGIGRAIIERFAKEGFDIFTCSRNEGDLSALRAALASNYPTCSVHTFVADLSKKEEVLSFAESVKALGIPDVIVHNTGVFLPGSLHEEADGNLEFLMDTNLYSAYYLTRAFAKELIQRRSGHVFSIGSIAGITAYANGGSYSVSKWAMLGMTKCFREEFKPHQIKVTSILPGATLTDAWAGVDLPATRFVNAEDVADSVWGAYNLSPGAVVEELIIRPQLGDI